jgi:hypothetical protein
MEILGVAFDAEGIIPRGRASARAVRVQGRGAGGDPRIMLPAGVCPRRGDGCDESEGRQEQ